MTTEEEVKYLIGIYEVPFSDRYALKRDILYIIEKEVKKFHEFANLPNKVLIDFKKEQEDGV